ARRVAAGRRVLRRVRNDIHLEGAPGYLVDGKADAVHAHRAFFREIAPVLRGHLDDQPPGRARGLVPGDRADTVDVARDEMPAEAFAQGERRLQVDAIALAQVAERGDGGRFRGNVR